MIGRFGEDGEDLRPRRAGDPLFRAVDHPAVAVSPRRRADRGGVRTGARFGQREGGGAPLAPRQRAEEPRALFLRRVSGEDRGGEVGGDHHDGDRGVGPRDRLHRQCVARGVEARPVILRRNLHRHAAKRGEFGHHVRREEARLVSLRCAGGEAFGAETHHGFAHGLLIVGEVEA